MVKRIAIQFMMLCGVIISGCQEKLQPHACPTCFDLNSGHLRFSPMVSFVDENGANLMNVMELEYISEGEESTRYRLVSENYSLHGIIDGKEYVDGDLCPQPERTVETSIDVIEFYRSAGTRPKFFRLNFSIWMHDDLYGYGGAGPQDFELIFKIPSISGEKEHSLKIEATALSLYFQRPGDSTAFFNGKEITEFKDRTQCGMRYVVTPDYWQED